MSQLGNGLFDVNRFEDALPVYEALLSTGRRIGTPEANLLVVQSNLANTYNIFGRREEANRMMRDIYCGSLKLGGEEAYETLTAASNYAASLLELQRHAEAKEFMRKTMPVGRRVLGNSNDITIRMRWTYAEALCRDPDATLDDLREAVETLEETNRTARRVFGASNPFAGLIGQSREEASAALRARETPSA